MFPLLFSTSVQCFFSSYGGCSTHILKSSLCFVAYTYSVKLLQTLHVIYSIFISNHPIQMMKKKIVNDIVHFGQFTKCRNITKLNLCI